LLSPGCRGASRRQTLQARIGRAGQRGPNDELAAQLALARQDETQAHELARDIRVLDQKLADIAQAYAIAEPLVRDACVLHRLPSTSPAYWQGWNRLRATKGGKFHTLLDTVSRVMTHTPRSSAPVETLNSRLRSYFTLRRHLGNSYLDLLQFFLNHRRFLRSRRAERQGKSPRELMTGQTHPHWLTLLGLGALQPQRA